MGATQIGTADIIFGITDNDLGYFEGLTFEQAGETVEILDGCGQIIAAFMTGEKTNVSGTFVLNSTATIPGRGEKITLAQDSDIQSGIGDLYITGITEEKSNSDATKVSFESTWWPFI